jgi:uncharacterized membrane-anchored protein YhcB (DUF1043 family)
MDTTLLDFISFTLGIIIGYIGFLISNAIYNTAEYLRYEVYKKEKKFKNTKKKEK